MVSGQETFFRKEYKYYVPNGLMPELRERILHHTTHDNFCVGRVDNTYQVRSIYFDTPRMLFYYEKMDGLRTRKKLRIRTYNTPADASTAFVEIKRKYNENVFKERALISMDEAPLILNGAADDMLRDTARATTALHHFVYLYRKLSLVPRVLITYEREAFLGIDDTEVRVTFDINVRSHDNPDIEDIFRDEDMRYLANSMFILEIKFYNRMPQWARDIVRDYSLRREAISKYCYGVDAWRSVAA